MSIFPRREFAKHFRAAISPRIPRSNRRRRRQLRYESLECRNLLAGDLLFTGSPLQNPLIPLDTNDDSAVSPIDALMVINQIAFALGEGEDGATIPTGTYPDVNGDQSITSVDAQIVIDYLANSGSDVHSLARSLQDDDDKIIRNRMTAVGRQWDCVSLGQRLHLNRESFSVFVVADNVNTSCVPRRWHHVIATPA